MSQETLQISQEVVDRIRNEEYERIMSLLLDERRQAEWIIDKPQGLLFNRYVSKDGLSRLLKRK